MKNIICAILFILFLYSAFAQANAGITTRVCLPEVQVDSDLLNVIDSVLVIESRESYYNKNFRYGISLLLDQNGDNCIQIEAIGRRVLKNGREFGIINYNNHTFIFYGKQNDRHLKITDRKIPFDFAVNQTKTMEDGTVLLDGLESDRFGIWIFRYEDKKLRLVVHNGITKQRQ